MKKPFVIALLGAESTGKSTLAAHLADALKAKGYSVRRVSEHLRDWCDANGRVPLQHEQAAIAHTQTERVREQMQLVQQTELVQGVAVVIADTTALMTAVYSDYLFDDQSLYQDALVAQKGYDLTLLMGLDMPWVADGLQRDGPHVRDAIDHLIRQALQQADIAAPTIYGKGAVRIDAALAMALQAIEARESPLNHSRQRSAWKHFCDCCGDGECEKLLAILAGNSPSPITP